MEATFNQLANLFAPMPVMELKAIWLANYRTEIMQLMDDGSYRKIKTARITKGDRVLIFNGKLKPVTDAPTHQITSCRGTATDQFSINVIDLVTLELSEIKL